MDFNKKYKSNLMTQTEKENRSVPSKGEYHHIPVRVSKPSVRNPLGALSSNTTTPGKTANNPKNFVKEEVKRLNGAIPKKVDPPQLKGALPKRVDPPELKGALPKRVDPPKLNATLPKKVDPPMPSKPSKKTTLEKRTSTRRSLLKVDIFADCLYAAEYFTDNYQYMLVLEKNFILSKSHLKKYIDVECRAATLNWLIQVQQLLKISESSFFKAVRIMDYFLSAPHANDTTDKKRYMIVAITSIWLTSKICDANTVKVSKLCEVQDDWYFENSEPFTKENIILMEREILKYVKFNLNCPDPSVFLYYYLCKEKLENDKKIWFSAMFLLETSTLSLEFSSAFPSLLAASALYLVLRKNSMKTDSFLKYIGSHLVDQDMFHIYAEKVGRSLKETLKQITVSGEVIEKYYTPQTLFVAQDFVD